MPTGTPSQEAALNTESPGKERDHRPSVISRLKDVCLCVNEKKKAAPPTQQVLWSESNMKNRERACKKKLKKNPGTDKSSSRGSVKCVCMCVKQIGGRHADRQRNGKKYVLTEYSLRFLLPQVCEAKQAEL